MPTSTGIKTSTITNLQLSVATLFMGFAAVAAAAVGTSPNACASAASTISITSGTYLVCPKQQLVHTVQDQVETYTVRGYSTSGFGLLTNGSPKLLSVPAQQTAQLTWENGLEVMITYHGRLRDGQARISISSQAATPPPVKTVYQAPVEQPTCADTDEGLTYDLKGTVSSLISDNSGTTSSVQKTDYCYVGDMTQYEAASGIGVAEYVCAPDNKTASVTYKICPHGCSDGACLPYFTGAPQLAIATDKLAGTAVASDTILYALTVAAPSTNPVSFSRITFALQGTEEVKSWLTCSTRVSDVPWQLKDADTNMSVSAEIIYTNGNGQLCSQSSILPASQVTFILQNPLVVSAGSTRTLLLRADTTSLTGISSGSLVVHVPADHTLSSASPYYLQSTLWWPGEQTVPMSELFSGNYLGLPLPSATTVF